MERLIKNVPAGILLLIYLFPVAVIVIFRHHIDKEFRIILIGVQTLFASIWTASMLSYIATESGSRKYITAAQVLIFIDLFLLALLPILAHQDFELVKSFSKFALAFRIGVAGFYVILARRVFYARAYWFLFVEFLIPIIGIYTLSNEVQKWEKEKLEEEDESITNK